MADSGRIKQSPDRRQAADYEPSNERAHCDRRVNSLFGSDDEDDPSSPVPSPVRSPARVSVQGDDDGVSHRKKSFCGTPSQWVPLRGVKTLKYLISPLKRSRGFCQNG